MSRKSFKLLKQIKDLKHSKLSYAFETIYYKTILRRYQKVWVSGVLVNILVSVRYRVEVVSNFFDESE